MVDPGGEAWRAPYRDKQRKNNPRCRRLYNQGSMVLLKGSGEMGNILSLCVQNLFWLPYPQKQDKNSQAYNSCRDINQPRSVEPRNQQLRETEGDSRDENRRP